MELLKNFSVHFCEDFFPFSRTSAGAAAPTWSAEVLERSIAKRKNERLAKRVTSGTEEKQKRVAFQKKNCSSKTSRKKQEEQNEMSILRKP